MVRAWLLFNAGEKKILDANDCDTVESLKKKFAPNFNCDYEQLEALLLAKRLPDSAQLTADAGVDDEAIITLLRKKCPAKVSCVEPPSKEEIDNDVRAFRQVVFVNEEDVNRQKIYELRKLTSSIQFVDEMVASIPSLDNDPIVRNVIHDWPLLLRWTCKPDVYKVAESHPTFPKVLAYLANALKQRSSSTDGQLNDVRSQIRFERMVLGSDSDTDVSSDDANPTSSGLNLPQLRSLPLSPELAAAFDMMMGRRSVRSQSSSEQQAEPMPSTSEGQRPILTTQMLQQALQSRTSFGHELQQSLDRFHEMGFADDEENKRILAQCNYDFDRALEMIIQRREENNNFS